MFIICHSYSFVRIYQLLIYLRCIFHVRSLLRRHVEAYIKRQVKNYSGAPSMRKARASVAPQLSKSIHRRKFGNDVTVHRPPARPSVRPPTRYQFSNNRRLKFIFLKCIGNKSCYYMAESVFAMRLVNLRSSGKRLKLSYKTSISLEDLDFGFVLQHFKLCIFVNECDEETNL